MPFFYRYLILSWLLVAHMSLWYQLCVSFMIQMVCSDKTLFSCDNLCGNPLSCGNHYCTKICHPLKGGLLGGESCEECSLPCEKVWLLISFLFSVCVISSLLQITKVARVLSHQMDLKLSSLAVSIWPGKLGQDQHFFFWVKQTAWEEHVWKIFCQNISILEINVSLFQLSLWRS